MKYFILFISALFFLFSCSTRKDKFLNRQYHALTTKYNVLYNGGLAFKKGLDQVEKTYEDDFSEILPVEPFSFYVEQQTEGGGSPIGQSHFERAEEKAVKAIQRHSMLLKGRERNYQMDEAYLLMAKSRYYTKRFGPALESFEYIIKNYPRASLIYETVVWRAKANIHIDNEEFGKRALKRLLSLPSLSPEIKQQAEIGVVMAYQKKMDSISQIAKHLEAALEAKLKGPAASRVAFVLGQVYQRKNMIEESDKAFDKAIAMKKGLYKFKLNAKLEKINNHIGESNTDAFLKELNHLIRAAKNRAYVGKLLYERGLVYESIDSIKLAKSNYTQAIQNKKTTLTQKVLSYEKLGDISYKLKSYEPAKSYYDSLLDVAENKKSRRYIKIKRKSTSLKKIVSTLKEADKNDSLIKLATMTDSELDVFFEDYIEKLKSYEKQTRLKELKLLASQNKTRGFDNGLDWYFYNSNERVKGKNTFRELWGNLGKSEQWYVKSLSKRSSVSNLQDSITVKHTKSTSKYKVAYYKNQINRESQFLDSIVRQRNLNYYELGNAYFSQLSEKDLAIEKLENLLTLNPSDDLRIGTYYRLYKIYEEYNDVKNASVYKQKLTSRYPDSSFTKLVNNVKSNSSDENGDSYVSCYETIFDLYRLNSINAAKQEMDEALQRYSETPLSAKYALLNAYIVAKLEGKESFFKLLKEIKFRYPNTEEAEKAIEIINRK